MIVNLTNQVFGKWKVLRRGSNTKGGSARWVCRCDGCGNEHLVAGYNLRRGVTKGCMACLRKTQAVKRLAARKVYATHDSEGLPIYGVPGV